MQTWKKEKSILLCQDGVQIWIKVTAHKSHLAGCSTVPRMHIKDTEK